MEVTLYFNPIFKVKMWLTGNDIIFLENAKIISWKKIKTGLVWFSML